MTGTAWLLVALAASSAVAGGASAQEPTPLGAPQPDRTVRDPEFGVVARHLGLERHVEMLQWQSSPGGYVRVWSPRAIDSTGFAPGHSNPGPIPLRSRRWVAGSVTVDGRPLDPQVIRRLGEWRELRPGFSALPGNLAATFQPEGNGLGSAENPLAPRIGDLRIHWRELVLPPLQGRVVLKDGRWRLVPSAVDPESRAGVASPGPGKPHARRAPWLFGGGAVIILVVALALRRRRSVR